MFRCVMIAEEDFIGVFEFATEAERRAFAKGASKGANCYGGGSFGVYDETDLEDLTPDEFGGEHARTAIAAIREHVLPHTNAGIGEPTSPASA